MKLTDWHIAILKAVGEGGVKHIHPYTFALPLVNDKFPTQATMRALTRNEYIKVDAASLDYMRDVTLTDKGRKAIEGLQA